MNEKQLK